MRIKQISVFVSNDTGRLVNMLKPLLDNQINIHALSVADSADFGIIRIVASDTEEAVKVLHDAGFTLQVNEHCRSMKSLPTRYLILLVDF